MGIQEKSSFVGRRRRRRRRRRKKFEVRKSDVSVGLGCAILLQLGPDALHDAPPLNVEAVGLGLFGPDAQRVPAFQGHRSWLEKEEKPDEFGRTQKAQLVKMLSLGNGFTL